MSVFEWVFIVLLIIGLVLAMSGFYIIAYAISEEKIYKNEVKKLETSLLNIFDAYYKTRDYAECIFEINILFKNIIFKNNRLNARYSNVIDLLEHFISSINTNALRVEKYETDLYKKALKEFIDEYKERNPLEQLKGNDFIVLNEIIECLERQEVEGGKKAINQLAVEMKSLRDVNMENEKNSRRQDLLAKIGIILSIVFGVMTFIQFFI